MPLDPARTVARARGAPRADRGRERRAAGGVDGDLGARRGRGCASKVAVTGARVRARRGGQPVVHAAAAASERRAADRRPHGLGAERRLARRLPQRAGRRRGAAPDRRARAAAGHRPARRLGRRGGRALRPLALRLVRRGGLDARPGRAARSSSTATASRCRRPCGTHGVELERALEARSQLATRAPTSSCTSSRARCWSRSTCRSASCSAPSASSARASRGAARPPTPARRRWTSAATRWPAPPSSRWRSATSPPRSAAARCARRAASSAGPASSPRWSRPRSSCSTSATSTPASSPACWSWRGTRPTASPPRRTIEVDLGADLADRADPLRRGAGRARRRGDPRGRGRVAPPPVGPLHDAAEVSRAGVPTVMLFVQSLRGLSHTPLEDTKPEHLELSVQALDRLASKTIERLAAAGLKWLKQTVAERPERQAPLGNGSEDADLPGRSRALLVTESDIALALKNIEAMLEGEDDGEEGEAGRRLIASAARGWRQNARSSGPSLRRGQAELDREEARSRSVLEPLGHDGVGGSSPMRSISISTTSPSCIDTGGVRVWPMPGRGARQDQVARLEREDVRRGTRRR